MESQLAYHMFMQGEIFEGVRALLVDKDQKPKWRYTSVYDVRPTLINEMFYQD